MGKLIVTVGCSRAGKSSYAKKWASEAPMRAVVNSDSIRLALHGQVYQQLAESFVHSIKEVMIRTLLSQGYDVLVDGTHTKESSIMSMLYIDKNAKFILFDTPRSVCKQRARDTNQEYLLPVIDRMWDQLCSLCANCGFKKKIEQLREKVIH